MRAWWQGLAARERWVLAGGLILLALLAGYVLALEPALARNAYLREQIEARRALLEEVRRLAGEAERLRAGAPSAASLPAGGSLLSVTNASAGRAGLQSAIKRVVPEGDRRLRLQFERVAFDRMIAWLEQLSQRHGIAVQALSLERLDTPGLVRADLVLAAG